MQDFFSEVLAEKIRTGSGREPDKNNHVSRRRRRLNEAIARAAHKSGNDLGNVSLDVVKQNRPKIERFIIGKNETPAKDDISLAIQAFQLRQKEEKEVADILEVTPEMASEYIDEAESKSEGEGSSESDNFIGDILGAIGNVANKALEKAKAKRQAKGKGTGLLNTLTSVTGALGSGSQVSYGEQNLGLGGSIKIAADEVIRKIKEAETKKQLNKMLPFFIIGIIVIVLITVLITKNAKNK